MDISRRGFMVSSVALTGTALIPLGIIRDRTWESPLIRESVYRLAYYHETDATGTGRLRHSLTRLEDDPGIRIRSIARAENLFLAMINPLETIRLVDPYENGGGIHRLIVASNIVAKTSRRGRGRTFFSSERTWERLGLTHDGGDSIGRWRQFASPPPFEFIEPNLTFYGTRGSLPIGDDIVSVYLGSSSFDGPAFLHVDKILGNRLVVQGEKFDSDVVNPRLKNQHRYQAYAVRFTPPTNLMARLTPEDRWVPSWKLAAA